MEISKVRILEFQNLMLDWYSNNGRDFPWRNTKDPYKILVSEFLLQKTHVRKVEDVYTEFLIQFPTIPDLAKSNINEVKDVIKPIGLLYRADRLIQLAKTIVYKYEGKIPQDYKALIGINGIGNYIANAILIFAFNEKRVIVDTNVIKVLESEFGYKSQKRRPRTDKMLWEFAQSLAPSHHIREFNWALLDFGATI
jgi:A/G-specific adenine glycosylase